MHAGGQGVLVGVSRATVYRIKKDRIIDSYKRKDWNRNLGGRP